MLHISEACSGWVGRVVSPHGERLSYGFNSVFCSGLRPIYSALWFESIWAKVIPNHSGLGAVRDSEWPRESANSVSF
ncbi:hypothetical protein F383_17762 [Gossypium arboreum]|uniref:Uncharacterized protein n=1 Tax=Gossypium arboreum TaxID=29729 RepID=A0A0B0NT98_GOSAR|nr:hypothetical protein F383_17762 [Gossypium arboreum]